MGVAAMLAIHCPAFTKRPPNAWGMFLEGIWVWFCSMKIAKTAADQCPCRRSATAQQKSVKLRRLRQNDSPRRVPQFCPLGPENRKWQWLASNGYGFAFTLQALQARCVQAWDPTYIQSCACCADSLKTFRAFFGGATKAAYIVRSVYVVLSVCLSGCLAAWTSLSLSRLPVCLPVWLFVSVCIRICMYMYVCVCVCGWVYVRPCRWMD